jgi:ABC-2 type transport system permease protein
MSAIAERVTRPSALGGSFRRFWALTWTLATTDFKLRFFGSALGYLWSLVRPLMLFGVLYLVFTQVFAIGSGIKNYPAYLLMSLMLWSYFVEATGTAVMSLTGRENLLRKIRFPRLVIPCSVALTSLFNLGLNLLAVLVFYIVGGIDPTWGWLWLPVLVLILVMFSTGIGMLLASLYVRFRDVAPIWEVITTVLFYGTPVLYVITKLPETVQKIEALNPVAFVTTQMRHAMLDSSAPSAFEVFGFRLLGGLLVLVGTFALGFWVFSREAPRIAENL